MSDITILVTRLQREAHESTDENQAWYDHIYSALLHFRGHRFRFTEKKGTFDLVAGQAEYAAGGTEPVPIPKDVRSIDQMWRVDGTAQTLIDEITIGELRELQSAGALGTSYPAKYAFHHQRWIFWPTPSQVWTINMDYLIDPIYSDAGVKFDLGSAPLTFTNAFFTDGEELLRTRVLYAWALARGRDSDLAAQMKILYREAYADAKGDQEAVAIDGQGGPGCW